MIKTADWLVDMGPEGGSRGGTVVAEGTPEQVVAVPGSFTGQFLAPLLDGREAKQPARRVSAARSAAAKTSTRSTTTKKVTTKKVTAKKAAAKKTATTKAAAKKGARG